MEQLKRKLNRLENYDYSQNGAYFITICIKDRQELLWKQGVAATCGRPYEIAQLSEIGLLIDNEIQKIQMIYDNVRIDKYVIMSNHIHMIIILEDHNGRPQVAPTVSRIVKQFKGVISKHVGYTIWQKLFHDHIIRSKQGYQEIWQYINENPLKWKEDCYYK